jgi:hypothetical protein
MAREIPEVVRAVAGLAATLLDEARKLPETLPGLPVRIIGLAMQQAMKVQQQYAGFVARGDELFTGMHGENEPGLATFDDDDLDEPVTTPGFRDSAFDRATAEPTSASTLTDAGVEDLPDDAAADVVTAEVDQLADQIEVGQRSIEELVEESPGTAEILDEIAIDELVDQAPSLEEAAPVVAAPAEKAAKPAAKKTAPGKRAAEKAAAAPADSTSSGAGTTTTDTDADTAATDTNAGPATADDAGSDTSESDAAIAQGAAIDAVGEASAAATDEPEGGRKLSGSPAPGAAPIDGYDSFSIAQLRGRLRGYALSTVQDLVAYEEATRAREPYLRMLRNRLEKVEEQAVEASPLAPRGV